MNLHRLCLGAAVATGAAIASPTLLGQTTPGPAELVVRGAAVVDVVAGRIVPDQDLVVRGTRIERIAGTGGPLPAAKTVIDGRGKYVIPGLVDVEGARRASSLQAAQAMLGFGVTAVGDREAERATLDRWRRDLDSGRRYAPRVVRPCRPAPARDAPADSTASSDAPDGLHDSLAALVSRGGRTPAEALRWATVDGAGALCLDAPGSLTPGVTADFVVLTANPLADIRNSRAIDAVVFRGEVLTQAHVGQLRQGHLRPPTPQ